MARVEGPREAFDTAAPGAIAHEAGMGREHRVALQRRAVEPGPETPLTDSGAMPTVMPATSDRSLGLSAEGPGRSALASHVKVESTAQFPESGARGEKPSVSAATAPVTADPRPPAAAEVVFRAAQRTHGPDAVQFDAARPQSARPETRDENRIHIGAVDIHITPPAPAPTAPVTRRAPTPAAPTISRGFVSPFGFRQG
jgi:hypothetical protein